MSAPKQLETKWTPGPQTTPHMASEIDAERAIEILKRAIDAAQNSNQAGENFVVAAASVHTALASLRELVGSLNDLMRHSGGVYGLHLNGALAPWDSLTEGGQFESWLLALTDAEDLLAKIGGDV